VGRTFYRPRSPAARISFNRKWFTLMGAAANWKLGQEQPLIR
jgi:hypothetical protein